MRRSADVGEDLDFSDRRTCEMTMTEYDETLPDTGMMTGSEAGDPGDRLADASLTPAERALLESLVAGGVPSVEASPETVRAAEDDATLPTPPPAGDDDPFTPTFREP
jgi:hypothetical protein